MPDFDNGHIILGRRGKLMNKRAWLTLSAVAAFLLIIFIGAKASAWTEFRSGEAATVPAGETVEGSLWVGAKSVDISGRVDGDVFCGAQTVNISGVIGGDVICGAQTGSRYHRQDAASND